MVPLTLHSFFIVGNIVLFLPYLIRSCEHSRHMIPENKLSSFIAEHLSARLRILQCVFSVGGVWSQLSSLFRIATKGATCVQTSAHLRMQLKYPVTKSCVCLRKFIICCCSGASSLIVATSKLQNCDTSEEERAKRLPQNGSKNRECNCSHNPMRSTSREMIERSSS